MTVEVRLVTQPQLSQPVLICGLPGSGYVGKIAVDHIVRELKAERLGEVYSYSFPPQVVIKRDGSVDPIKNEFFAWHNPAGNSDLLIYTGDSQPVSPEANYELADRVLQVARDAGVRTVYTFGAYITGSFTERPRVYATATNKALVGELAPLGVELMSEGSITGMNGLLLGMAKIRGMDGICFLGETSGYIIDAKAAQQVLEVLSKRLGLSLDMARLEERAKEVEGIIRTLEEMQRKPGERATEKGRLGYIS
jgi:hypothetical protein